MNRLVMAIFLVALQWSCSGSKESSQPQAQPTVRASSAAGNDGPLKVYEQMPRWPAGQQQAMLARFQIQNVSLDNAANEGKGDEVVSVRNGTDFYIVGADVRFDISRGGIVVTKTAHCKHARGLAPGDVGSLSCGMPAMNSLTSELAGNFSIAALYAVTEKGGVLYAKPIEEDR